MKHFSLATAVVLAAVSAIADSLPDPAKLPPVSNQQDVTFSKDIRPIFDETCVRCHGAQRPRAALRLDSVEGVLKGSKDHVVVVSGHSEQSRLVFAVSDINGKISMPPKPRPPRAGAGPNGGTNAPAGAAAQGEMTPPPGPMGPPPGPAHPWKPLTPEQVGVIRAWIDQGAKP